MSEEVASWFPRYLNMHVNKCFKNKKKTTLQDYMLIFDGKWYSESGFLFNQSFNIVLILKRTLCIWYWFLEISPERKTESSLQNLHVQRTNYLKCWKLLYDSYMNNCSYVSCIITLDLVNSFKFCLSLRYKDHCN